MDADGILSYHLSPMTCGVAKFNLVLARHLGVPLIGLFDRRGADLRCPLLSIKPSELLAEDLARLEEALGHWPPGGYHLFLHDFGDSALEHRLARDAALVYCANSELRLRLAGLRPDAVELWCPGTLLEAEPLTPTELSVFSFGMSHKVRLDHYRRLDRLLERTGRSSSLLLSTALHDHRSFDEAFSGLLAGLRGVFGSRLYFLGFLSDRVIHHHLTSTTYFAAFFEAGVRANNTSVHAAMQCGAAVITNLDAHSPAEFVHGETVIDIRQSEDLPSGQELADIRRRGLELSRSYGWESLLARMR